MRPHLLASVLVVSVATFARAEPDVLPLDGPWSEEPGWTRVTVERAEPTRAIIHYAKSNVSLCGCAGVRTRIELGANHTCADTTIQFDFDDARAPNAQSERGTSVSVWAVYCKGHDCGSVTTTSGQYADNATVATDGREAATMCWHNETATLSHGAVNLPAGGHSGATDGTCHGDFDAIELHVKAAACGPNDAGTITIANLRVGRPAPPPPPSPQPIPPTPPSATTERNDGTPIRHWSALPNGHISYGIGGAVGDHSGFRQGLELALGVTLYNRENSTWTAAAMLNTGFGAYPTYVGLDLGKAFFLGTGMYGALFGWMFTLGPAIRVLPDQARPGATIGFRAYALMIQLGLRMVYTAAPGGDGMIEGTLGAGFL